MCKPSFCRKRVNRFFCQVVANNMMAAVYNDHVDNAENDSVIVTTFRVACAVPPLLWALLFKDFAAIVGYAGEPNSLQTGHKCRRRSNSTSISSTAV